MSNRKYRTAPEQEAAGAPGFGDAGTGEDLYVGSGPLSDGEARAMLARSLRFLDTIVYGMIEVLGSIRLECVRDAIDHTMPYPVGRETDREPAVEVPEVSNPQKRPRGRRHPLLSMIVATIGAVRLQMRIMKVLKPHMTTYADSYDNLMAGLKEAEATVAGYGG